MIGVVMPHGVLFRGGKEKLIREIFIKDDVIESIINAPDIKKELKSTASLGDRLYIIEAPNLDGLWIYTKGKLMKHGTEFYVLISSKLST